MRVKLQFHITGKCNLRCKHCYIDEHSSELSFSDFKKTMRQFKRLVKKVHSPDDKQPPVVHITGGEPFIHKDIKKILAWMKKHKGDFAFGFLANGTVLPDDVICDLREISPCVFQVSIDGNESTHNDIRGEDNFRRVFDGVDKLVAAGIRVQVSFTANKQNFMQIPEIASACRQHKVSVLWSDRYIPFGDGPLTELSADDMRIYAALLHREKYNPDNKAARLFINNGRALQFLHSGNNPYYCRAGEEVIVVDERGDIMPCRRLPIVCGNIKSTSLKRVYFKSKIILELKKHIVEGKCLKCRFNSVCKGGERCFTYAKTGSLTLPDPCCWLAEEQ